MQFNKWREDQINNAHVISFNWCWFGCVTETDGQGYAVAVMCDSNTVWRGKAETIRAAKRMARNVFNAETK